MSCRFRGLNLKLCIFNTFLKNFDKFLYITMFLYIVMFLAPIVNFVLLFCFDHFETDKQAKNCKEHPKSPKKQGILFLYSFNYFFLYGGE